MQAINKYQLSWLFLTTKQAYQRIILMNGITPEIYFKEYQGIITMNGNMLTKENYSKEQQSIIPMNGKYLPRKVTTQTTKERHNSYIMLHTFFLQINLYEKSQQTHLKKCIFVGLFRCTLNIFNGCDSNDIFEVNDVLRTVILLLVIVTQLQKKM